MLKKRLTDEGAAQSLTDCLQLKMQSRDRKHYKTDAANTETILRIIQSIPSPKAEPFKRWLARVGTERLHEDAGALTPAERRLASNYRRQGYVDSWINDRLRAIRDRNGVTGEWGLRGAKKGREYAALTDTLSVGAFDITTAEHRQIKGLSARDNLQDSETSMELAITGLADAAARRLHQTRDSQGFNKLQADCQDAGKIVGDARRQFEEVAGEKVVSPINYKQLQQERRASYSRGYSIRQRTSQQPCTVPRTRTCRTWLECSAWRSDRAKGPASSASLDFISTCLYTGCVKTRSLQNTDTEIF
jgi:hypothetical protein